MDVLEYPAIQCVRKTGDEKIIDCHLKPIGKIVDFWQWAYSDLLGNAERGILAEYLVACALGVQGETRDPWAKYDLLSKDGISVEIKASGYLQTWYQKDFSRLTFGIQPTYGWNSETNCYEKEKRRQADIYVFCVYKHRDQESANPLDLNQWEFYVLRTEVLNEALGNQKNVTLTKLIKLGAKTCSFEKLNEVINQKGR